jgi:transposase
MWRADHLAVADGLSNQAAASRLATRPATASKWRGRFVRDGLAGVADASRGGKPRHDDGEDERRILAALETRRHRRAMRVGTAPCWPSI